MGTHLSGKIHNTRKTTPPARHGPFPVQASRPPPRRPLPAAARPHTGPLPARAAVPPPKPRHGSPRQILRTPQIELAVSDGVGVLSRLLDQLRRQLHHPAEPARPRRAANTPPSRSASRAPSSRERPISAERGRTLPSPVEPRQAAQPSAERERAVLCSLQLLLRKMAAGEGL